VTTVPRKSTVRSREIKPSFWDNDPLIEYGLETRMVFIGLWCMADREGRLLDNPGRIKRRLNLEGVDIEAALANLAAGSDPFIVRYTADAYACICIVNFKRHQNINKHEAQSELPPQMHAPEMQMHLPAMHMDAPEMHLHAPSVAPSVLSVLSGSDLPSEDLVGHDAFPTPRAGDTSVEDAKAAVAHLNQQAGRNYTHSKASDPGVKSARAILKDHSLDQVKAVIDGRVTAWASDPKMCQFLTPSTIFRPAKFADYLGQLGCQPARPARATLNLIAQRGEPT
jgi:uncharacterized phage protein (TIGR02220 family)